MHMQQSSFGTSVTQSAKRRIADGTDPGAEHKIVYDATNRAPRHVHCSESNDHVYYIKTLLSNNINVKCNINVKK